MVEKVYVKRIEGVPKRSGPAISVDVLAEVASAPASEVVDKALVFLREMMGMDVAFVASLTSKVQTYDAIDGDVESFGVRKGMSLPADNSYCRLMVDGKLPNIVPDSTADPRVAHLPGTVKAGIKSYIGVPLKASDGRIYGTLCCVDRESNYTLDDRDVQFMFVLARLVSDSIDQRESDRQKAALMVETAGTNALLAALEARDGYTGEHSEEVVNLAIAVGEVLNLSDTELRDLKHVARLHDIGKIGIPDAILRKESHLEDEEWAIMKTHPAVGADIAACIEEMSHLRGAIRAGHERWDGRGYPDGLSSEEIPLTARITFACDAWHAMTSDRPYRQAMSQEAALEELRRCAGTQFDPAVVGVLLRVLRTKY